MLEQVVFPAVRHAYQRYGVDFDGLLWLQDGAPAHGTLAVRRLLWEWFSDRVIALHLELKWPPRSPDLTPLDFFLWGYLKQKVFFSPPPDLATIRRRIVDEVSALRQNIGCIRRSFSKMTKRANRCIEMNGSHVECF